MPRIKIERIPSFVRRRRSENKSCIIRNVAENYHQVVAFEVKSLLKVVLVSLGGMLNSKSSNSTV